MLRSRGSTHLSVGFSQKLFTPHLRSGLLQHIRRVQNDAEAFNAFLRSIRYKKALIWSCIGANTFVWFCWQAAQRPSHQRTADSQKLNLELQKNFLLATQNLREGRWWVVITSTFSHVSFWHLFANMFTFQQLSQTMVYTPGLTATRHLAPLILGSGLAGSFAFLSHESATAGSQRVGLGFSGAVSGVVTAAACLMPHQRVLFFGIIPIPLWALAAGYMAYDTYAMDGDTSVAHDAHIGGSIFGGLFYMLVLKRFGGILGPRLRS